MSSELSADGKGARLNTDSTTTPSTRAAAFRFICRNTHTREDEDQLLWQLDLHYKPQPSHQEGTPE